MKLPTAIREQFRAYGRDGGRARARRMSPAERRRVAREAVLRRWMRARFGVPSFAELGLPGGEMVDAGLAALAAGQETVESLVVIQCQEQVVVSAFSRVLGRTQLLKVEPDLRQGV